MSKKVTLIVSICILGVAMLTLAATYFGIKYFKSKKIKTESKEIVSQAATNNSSAPGASEISGSANPGNTHADWLTYSNSSTSYMISYPTEAKVEDLSNPKTTGLSHSKCIKISTENYYVIVGNADASNICFRNEASDDWATGPTEIVTPAGASYTVTGMHKEAASAGYYYDYFLIDLLDGVNKMEYGITVNEKYGTMTKSAASDLVHQIVATYNPAQ